MMMKRSLAAMAALCLGVSGIASAKPVDEVFKCTVVSVTGPLPGDLVRGGDAQQPEPGHAGGVQSLPVRVGDAQAIAVGPGVWNFWNEKRKQWAGDWCSYINRIATEEPAVSCGASKGVDTMTRRWVREAHPITIEDDFDRATNRWKEVGRETASGGTAIFQVDRDCRRIEVRDPRDTEAFGAHREGFP
jgi:hypothetical protein